METPVKNKREKPTRESVNGEIEVVIQLIGNEIEKLMKSTSKNKNSRLLRSVRKKLINTQKHVNKLPIKKKREVTTDGYFSKPRKISAELQSFTGVSEELSPVDAFRAVCAYIHLKEDETREQVLRWKHLNPEFRNLKSPSSNKVIQPDAKLSKLLRYDEYCKDVKDGKITTKKGDLVSDPALYYHVIVKLLQKHF